MTDKRLLCPECDELLQGYLENDLDAETRSDFESHAAACARCQGLIRDIEGIGAAARSLPDLVPSRDLWSGIESRIQPAVVSLPALRMPDRISRRLLIAAAASLVVVTSSVTYVTTGRVAGGSGLARRVSDAPGVGNDPAGATAVRPSAAAQSTGSTPLASTSVSAAAVAGAPGPSLPNRGDTRATLASTPVSASEKAMSSEIATLEALLDERRDQLDPVTVRVVEENLRLIDIAVRQARTALARDPASGFLNGSLDNALQKKIELLRTAAFLPSRS